MKIAKLAALAFAFILISSVSVKAQKNFMKDAEKAFDAHEYFSAIELYKKAYTKVKKKEDKAKTIFQIAECYRMINDYKNSEQWYDKSVKAKYPDPIAILYYANSKKLQGKYDEALVQYNNYKKENPSDPRGEDGAKSCELAAKWKNNPSRYKVENMVQINSKVQDFSPAYADKKYATLYFTSTREGSLGDPDKMTGQTFSDIFETKVDKNGKWSTPTPLAKPLNGEFNDGSCVLSLKKANLVFFTRCLMEKNEQKNCQLMTATKKGNVWDDPTLVPFCVDSFIFGHPAMSQDEQTLIFGSDMPGGYGSMDLWVSTFDKKAKAWGKPVNLGPGINTPGYESFPFIADDGTLYYSSDGNLGMGGLDIFKAQKKSDDQWGNVTNLQYPLNSPSDDFGIIFEGKRNRGYLSSNREGGKGSDDIYSFYMPPILFTIEGVVTNCKAECNGEVIPGVPIKLVGSDGTTSETVTDAKGYYKFQENGEKRYVNENTSYVISTGYDPKTGTKTACGPLGFLNSSVKAKETTVGIEESKIFKHDFCLTPIERTIRFPEVQYGLDSANIRPASKDSLDFLYRTLVDNPGITIELSAHTDSRGSDKHNEVLSQARAKSCVDYLVSKGITAERMTPKGYGEKRLMYSDAEVNALKTKEEQEAMHQKNRRTVFTVLRTDYVDPNAPKEAPQEAPKQGTEEEKEE